MNALKMLIFLSNQKKKKDVYWNCITVLLFLCYRGVAPQDGHVCGVPTRCDGGI